MKILRSAGWPSVAARFGAGIVLARLTLAATIMASPMIEAAAPGDATRGSAFGGGDTADEVDAYVVDLNSFEAKAKAVAAAGRTVHDKAARMLDRLARSGFPDEKLRAEAALALKEASKLSYRLATASDVLADAIESASGGKLAPSMELGQLLEAFDLAKAEFDRSTAELLKQIRTVRSHETRRESIADEIARLEGHDVKTAPGRMALFRLQASEREAIEGERVQLQALIDSTRPSNTAQKTLTAAIYQLAPILAPPVTRQAPDSDITASVYGFFDQQKAEEEGYGLYTYVLLAADQGTSQRNVAFLRVLLASTRHADRALTAWRRQLNIFYVPAHSSIQALVIARSSADAAAAIAASGVYHYEQAERLLFRLCMDPATSSPNLCSSAWRGPYLLTLPGPLNDSGTIRPTHLFVDLSDIHESAFGEFLSAIKEQVMLPDFTDRQKIDTLRLRLLDITLKAADWLDPIKEGIAEIVFLGGDQTK